MILDKLFIKESFPIELNLDYILGIPEFRRLCECEQNPVWHAEGNVFEHTKLSCENLYKEFLNNDIDLYNSLSESELLIIRSAVLFHDIGKGVTTFQGKDGKWHAYGHEYESEKITRKILWNENIDIREIICSLVRYHMEVLKIFDSKNWLIRMIEIGYRVPWKLLYCVKMADIYGSVHLDSVNSSRSDDLLKMKFIKETAINLGIWDNINYYHLKNLVKYGNNKELFPWKIKNSKDKIAFVMIGLSGAGKNTIIDKKILSKYDNALVLSRDDIRIELGYCGDSEKYLGSKEEEQKVSELFNKRFEEGIRDGRIIVLNNLNLKKKYREESVRLLRKNGYVVKFVYVEAPTLEHNYERRKNDMNKEVINNMILSFDFPEPNEYDELYIKKERCLID